MTGNDRLKQLLEEASSAEGHSIQDAGRLYRAALEAEVVALWERVAELEARESALAYSVVVPLEQWEDLERQRAALAEACRAILCQQCGGRGFADIPCPDPQCGDSTWDHYCGAGIRPCSSGAVESEDRKAGRGAGAADPGNREGENDEN